MVVNELNRVVFNRFQIKSIRIQTKSIIILAFLSKIRRFYLFSSVFLLNLKENVKFRLNYDKIIKILRIYHLFRQNT